MSDNMMKWIAGILAGLGWFVLVLLKMAPVDQFVLFIQGVLLVAGTHGMATSGKTATPPADTPPAPPRLFVPGQGGRVFYSLLCFVAAGLLLLLGGCAVPIASASNPIGAFTLQDAQGASALAKQNNDTAGQKCYDYIAEAAQAAAAVPFTPGLLYLNEIRRTAATSTAGLAQACAGVIPIGIVP